MENITLFDDPHIRQSLLPFTFTRPVAAIRVGIQTIAEKWQSRLQTNVGYATSDYLASKFPRLNTAGLYINGALCPNDALIKAVMSLKSGQVLTVGDHALAANLSSGQSIEDIDSFQKVTFEGSYTFIQFPWQVYKVNAAEIRADFEFLTKGRTSAKITDPHTMTYGIENIFIEEGVSIKAAILNAESGPIYLGKNAQVHEGAIIKGPFALGEGAHVNMGAKIKGDTTVGPYSKVGGEISNSVIFGYSNKGHDGFLGNSVIGEWCNLGADTNTSNMKNNYAQVKLWSYTKGGFVNTGEQFCGLMMGDHAKAGINTMFNTGTVVGVGANIFGDGFPRNFIPSFSWGGAAGFTTFTLNKFYEVAEKAMERRQVQLTEVDKVLFSEVFDLTKSYRIWDK
ncbi:GlmU family protein [Penaeicola halotolerans]|uniref:GlmU family protein n=1 Tax=Penaeicola halotolerans TaxID=2793196 RepID=UPI001CF876C6|nr:GlmU family protein [Penaeicola halotolerans]